MHIIKTRDALRKTINERCPIQKSETKVGGIPGDSKRPADTAYIASGLWKCNDSPTGSHYWICTNYEIGEFTCQFCKHSRTFQLDWSKLSRWVKEEWCRVNSSKF